MCLYNKLRLLVFLAVLFILEQHIGKTDAASCSVMFHWRAIGDARSTEGKNWSTLETEITGSRGKLSTKINPNTTFGFTLKGDCCWEVYPENSFKGDPVELKTKLPNGFGGIPGHPRFIANSLKKKSPKPCKK